jgi:peptide/nickel transport system ATP-binding protein/oligopeptide transport system ATP-binding protein
MSMVLVTHDMGVVARMADRITVMYAGRVCETADAARSSMRPSTLHGRALLESVPQIDQSYSGAPAGAAEHRRAAPDLLHAPPGCRFHDRCPEAAPECRRVMPREHLLAPGHSVSCLRRGSPGEEAP